MAILNEYDGWPLSNREYAFGWLVFGMGLSLEAARDIAAGATARKVAEWSLKQRRALAGFNNMLERIIGPNMPTVWGDPAI